VDSVIQPSMIQQPGLDIFKMNARWRALKTLHDCFIAQLAFACHARDHESRVIRDRSETVTVKASFQRQIFRKFFFCRVSLEIKLNSE